MSRHVQSADASVLERRLRPIYEWLDCNNNKKALQECEKVLKKTPTFQCVRALKALILFRMGRENDCKAILESLNSEQPTDDSTLQAMTMCYRELQDLQKVCKMYEIAVKKEPTNEELHTQLFMSYVKVHDFKAQQQCAMALYKQKPKNPYYCWVVMSIVLQATRGEGSKDQGKKTLLLNLAERMMKKMVDDKKIDAEQEIQLYIMVLGLLGRNEEVIALVESPLGEKMQFPNSQMVKLNVCAKLERWQQVNIICKNILSERRVWKTYVHSVFELAETNINGLGENGSAVETADNTAEKCHEFICTILEGVADNSKRLSYSRSSPGCPGFSLRGPYLARFELGAKLQEKQLDTNEILGDISHLFIEYFRKFGHKPCCVVDLKIYLKLLDSDQKSELAGKLVKEVGIGPTSVPQSADQMQRHIGALQLSRLCGAHRNLSVEHLRALVTALFLHYQHGYQAYGKDLPATELGPSDNYAILAAHILFDLSIIENEMEYVVVAIALLGGLLKNSPSNFHAKLLVVKFYHILGVALSANFVYYTLDIKHLQLDSLGYIHCAQLATTGLFELCSIHFDSTARFFATNYKESIDHLTFSYKFGSFIKLDEFMDFREKMNNSTHYAMVVVDRIVLNLINCHDYDRLCNLDIPSNDSEIEWDKLSDNRDLDVYLTWDPEFASESVSKSKAIQRLYTQNLNFLKLRTRLLQTVSAALKVVQARDGERQKRIEHLKQTLKDWRKLEDEVKKTDLDPIPENLIPYPPASRLHGYLDTPYRPVIAAVLDFQLSLAIDELPQAEISCKSAQQQIEVLAQQLESVLTDSVDYRKRRKGLEMFVNNLELICISCVLCILCTALVKPSHSKRAKKKQPVASRSKDLLLSLVVNSVKKEIDKVSKLLQEWSEKVTEKDLAGLLGLLNLNTGNTETSEQHQIIMESYEISYKHIKNVFAAKLKLLDDL
ncbi:hypothetical protein D910_12321 [Dendroctonus ponderosae]|uniref:N-terminal acetyltransferase B complex subunit MDM20 homolog n=1 Tax=Dendroctonus ponderosae TaxID=77166 RepID=U4UXH7_DENPD|nr:hypothetical protein D910_12321 [Dendroctonus ponderosae]